ncbi:uncharacterized protein LOC142328138 [Lycorma delicatula]|uniref:uncharacterized protein LOC142328138 n=1 Tax=Lycorma delicatula TaxID=130591 RepID=UPI003F512F73
MQLANLLMVLFLVFTINKLVKTEGQTGSEIYLPLGLSLPSLHPNKNKNTATKRNVETSEKKAQPTNPGHATDVKAAPGAYETVIKDDRGERQGTDVDHSLQFSHEGPSEIFLDDVFINSI